MQTSERTVQAAKLVRVALVEDHEMVRAGLAALLERERGVSVVAQAGALDEAEDAVLLQRPDIVLLDMKLGRENGLELIPRLREAGCLVPVLVLTAQDSVGDLREAVAAGAAGYLLKSGDVAELAGAIRSTLAGQPVVAQAMVPRLVATVQGAPTGPDPSPRERQVLAMVVDGASNRVIAEALGLSLRTVHKHVENLFRKFGVSDRTSLVREAFRHGLAA